MCRIGIKITQGHFRDSFFGIIQAEKPISGKGGLKMKGYYTKEGFWGLVNSRYMLFASETDYYEMMEEAA